MLDKILKAVHDNLENWNTPQNLALCLSCIDLTTLNTTDTQARVEGFAAKVNGFKAKYPQYPLPAAICVYSNWGGAVKNALKEKDVKVAPVLVQPSL